MFSLKGLFTSRSTKAKLIKAKVERARFAYVLGALSQGDWKLFSTLTAEGEARVRTALDTSDLLTTKDPQRVLEHMQLNAATDLELFHLTGTLPEKLVADVMGALKGFNRLNEQGGLDV